MLTVGFAQPLSARFGRSDSRKSRAFDIPVLALGVDLRRAGILTLIVSLASRVRSTLESDLRGLVSFPIVGQVDVILPV